MNFLHLRMKTGAVLSALNVLGLLKIKLRKPAELYKNSATNFDLYERTKISPNFCIIFRMKFFSDFNKNSFYVCVF